MKKEIISKSLEETQKLGEDFIRSHLNKKGETLTSARITALYGDLGAGKTTFTQGLARGLGIKKRIISPTFIIIRQYKIKDQNLKFFYHVDLYRVQGESDIKGLGIQEILSDPENLVVIEWAERMEDFLPENRIDVKFEHLEEDKRRITIERINN